MKTVQVVGTLVVVAWMSGLSLPVSAATQVIVDDGIATLNVTAENPPYTMTAEDAAAILATGITEFRKTGAGTLVADASHASLATFAGTIRIQNGIYKIAVAGDCGADGCTIRVESSEVGKGQLYVDNGSTALDLNNRRFHVAGTGPDEKGAIYFNTADQSATVKYIELSADASVWIGAKGVTFNGTIDLLNHTLDIEPIGGYCAALGNATVKNGGQIVFDRERRQKSSGLNFDWTYEPSEGATLTMGGYVNNVPDVTKTPWTWIVHQVLNFRQNGGAGADSSYASNEANITSATYGMYGGPVTLNADVVHGNNSAGRWQITGFKGPVRGSGNISMVNENDHNRTWFKFGSANPEWTGQISVKRKWEINTNGTHTAEHANGLALFADGALTQKTLELRNADLYLAGDDPVQHLPDIKVEDSGRFWGPVTGRVGTVEKTGVSTLTIANRLVVTNEIAISSGTLRIDPALAKTAVTSHYNYAELNLAGLSEVLYIGNAPAVTNGPKIRAVGPVAGFFDGNNEACTTGLGKYVKPGYEERPEKWHGNDKSSDTRYQYDGYLWNRNATNETWGFMSCVNYGSEIWMENERGVLEKFQSGEYFSSTGDVVTAYAEHVLKPGPNRIRIFVKGNQGGSAGANIATSLGESGDIRAWAKPKAFCYDRTGANLLKQGVWTKTAHEGFTTMLDMAEQGDLFTTVPYTRDELLAWYRDEINAKIAAALPDFNRLRFAAGTVLDLGGAEHNGLFAVNDVVGAPRVVNGCLRVKGAWTLAYADLKANGPVELDGGLEFAAGSSLVIDDLEKVPSRCEIPLFHAVDGIGGVVPETVTFTQHPLRAASARLRLSKDGKSLSLEVVSGMLILFK